MPAAITDYFKRVGAAGTLTTLAAPGKAVAAGSINVASTTNWPTTTGIVLAIRQVDAAGALVAGTYTEWRGTVSGTTITIETTPVYGTDQVYSAGSTTQVFIPVSAEREDDFVDGILIVHEQTGLLKSGVAMPSPVVSGTSWADFLTGWRAGSGTWTYASATTMTVPAADAAAMNVGTKLKLTQTTAKYFYVTGISGTTITLTGGSDYSLANASITSPLFSNDATPAGHPHVFNYTPVWTASGSAPAIGNGALSGLFSMIGKTVEFTILFVAGGTTTFGTGTYYFTLPVTAAARYNSASQRAFTMTGYAEDAGVAGYGITGARMKASDANNFTPTTGSAVLLTPSSPMAAWANGDFFDASGVYRVV